MLLEVICIVIQLAAPEAVAVREGPLSVPSFDRRSQAEEDVLVLVAEVRERKREPGSNLRMYSVSVSDSRPETRER